MSEEKKWFEISLDELEHRMQIDKERRIDPLTEMGKEFFRCIDKVLIQLGVDLDSDIPIIDQCKELGIFLRSNSDELTPQLHGVFVSVLRTRSFIEIDQEPDIFPYAWVSAPFMLNSGKAKCEIQYFQDERMEESREVKIV